MSSFWSQICFCSNCCETNTKKSEENVEPVNKHKNKPANKVKERNVSVTPTKNNVSVKKVIIDPSFDQISVISTNIDTEEEETQKLLIDEQKFREELANSIKGREDSYGRVMIRQKSLLLEKYNEFGVIDINSEQFSVVKNLMNSRGYELIESIGSGNYAEVYKACSGKKRKEVAIKVIDIIEINRKYGITFIPREVNIVRKITHKNIIKVYEMIKTPTKIYVAMELAVNGSVADLVSKRGAFTEFMSRIIFVSILEGLDHMHSKKIAHRNLKLENILLSENLNPKISDFCFALIVDQKRPKSQTFYSLSYFAPEILQNLPHNPFISDIWSLGVCLYIMVSDCLPFKLGDEKEMLEKQLISDWSFRQSVEPKLSKELKNFIGVMLEPDISLRPTTYNLLRYEWIQREPPSDKYFSTNNK